MSWKQPRSLACAKCGRTEFPHLRKHKPEDDIIWPNFSIPLSKPHEYGPMDLHLCAEQEAKKSEDASGQMH
jgi:hypothetical protein